MRRSIVALLALSFFSAFAAAVHLPWGDINVVVVTDVHAWVAGHALHPFWSNATDVPTDAGYGDVLSFYQRLQSDASRLDKDLFFVMNGDFMDGTGLSTIPPEKLLPILKRMPWDAVNIGNHELYHSETIEYMVESGFIDYWRGGYLTSNVDLIQPTTTRPLGNRYTYLYAANSNTTILTFGFLYNFQGNCNVTRVRTVQQIVKERWFRTVLRQDDYDAILILAHMGYRDPLVTVLLQAIRDIVGQNIPIQFINGHTHIRGFQTLDDTATSFEAGHFLDTVGFVSFPVRQAVGMVANHSSLFQHLFLDANKQVLANTLGVEELSTPDGDSLSLLINDTQKALGLHTTVGCVPFTYQLDAPLTDPTSLWRLFLKQVVPKQLFANNQSHVYIENSGAFRYNLFEGVATLDDLIAVAPFNDTVYKVAARVTGTDLANALNNQNVAMAQVGMLHRLLSSADGEIESNQLYDIYTAEFETQLVSDMLQNASSSTYPMVPFPVLNDRNQSVSTAMLWSDFIRSEWPCRASVKESSHLTMVSFVVLLVVFGTYWVSQHYSHSRRLRVAAEVQEPLLNGIGNTYGAV